MREREERGERQREMGRGERKLGEREERERLMMSVATIFII